MDCPFCGKPMEKGSILNNSMGVGIIWIPEGKKRPWGRTDAKVLAINGLVLSEPFYRAEPFYKVAEVINLTCYVCRDCGKGIFNFDN